MISRGGAADDSYGIEVARPAGVPHEIIKRARVILDGPLKKSAAAQRLFESEEPVPDEPENVSFEDLGAAELRDRIAAPRYGYDDTARCGNGFARPKARADIKKLFLILILREMVGIK